MDMMRGRGEDQYEEREMVFGENSTSQTAWSLEWKLMFCMCAHANYEGMRCAKRHEMRLLSIVSIDESTDGPSRIQSRRRRIHLAMVNLANSS